MFAKDTRMPNRTLECFTLTDHAVQRMTNRHIGRSGLEAAILAGRIERPDQRTTLYIITRQEFGPAGPGDTRIATHEELVVVVLDNRKIATAYVRQKSVAQPLKALRMLA
jgi:hypothetical protein